MKSHLFTRRSRHQQKGYILALNLAVLAIMLMGASYVGQRVIEAVGLAKAEQRSVDIAYELESARARLLVMLATTPRFLGGLGSLDANARLDGREYRMGDTVLVSLQDMRGLVSINGTSLDGFGRERIERLLHTWDVPDIKATALTDALLDYRDADDLRRLNGAERDEYRSVGAEADLRNADLLSPTEVLKVYGWRDTPELWGPDPITEHISTQRGSGFNPNAAGWRALVAMAGIEAATAKSLVDTRLRGEVNDISGLLYGAGVGDPFGVNSFVMPFPGPTLIVTLRSADAPWGYRMVVTHTPGDNTAPWRIGAVWRLALPKPSRPLTDIPQLPDAMALRGPNTGGQIKSPF
jgi:general secretion pathway protein K